MQKIALAGNPNSGKTTMFNALTGSNQYVGNWPGVTVEKKEGPLLDHADFIIQDLPGIYSLSPYTPEEIITRKYLLLEKPDAIINIVDASNIERNLYLTLQLQELGIPVIVALNMIDVLRKRGDAIDTERLSEALGCPVMEMSAIKEEGIFEAAHAAIHSAIDASAAASQRPQRFTAPIEETLLRIEGLLGEQIPGGARRFIAVKLFERDEKIGAEYPMVAERAKPFIAACEREMGGDSESLLINERYERITSLVADCARKAERGATASERIDSIVMNRYLAMPILAAVMFLVYFVAITLLGAPMSEFVGDTLFGGIIPPAAERALTAINAEAWLISFLVDGVIAGVGAVLGFLPQMFMLFLLLSLLEDCGYVSRVAFITDALFRRFGLSGKSFIPILLGTGCGVPGIMATRTIESDRDRKITVIATTFIPCSAKLPVIALISGALFGGAWWVAPSAYLIGVCAIVCSGIILRKARGFAGEPAQFIMELPDYHLPSAKGVLRHTYTQCKSFIKKAGTIIFLASALIWFLSSFSFSFRMVDAAESMLAKMGGAFAPLFAPLGFGEWQSAVAVLTGLVAKENVVATFGILYGGAGEATGGNAALHAALRGAMTPLAAYAFLMFNLLCAPCVAAVSAIRREMGSMKWTLLALSYQTGLAYAASMAVYQIGSLLSGGAFGIGSLTGLIILAGFIYLLLSKSPQKEMNAPSPLPY